VAALLGAALLGLAACGGDDEEAASTAIATATATSEATQSASSGGGKKTAPGAKLAVGDTAHVDMTPLDETDTKKTYPIDATVLKIERGSLDDFKNIDLDAQQKQSTPYYVKVRLSNPGGTIPVQSGDPDLKFGGIDDRGQEQGSITFIGDFDRCEDAKAPKPFKKGSKYESCLTYLVPGGGGIESVQWQGSERYILKPVMWK